jgi:hypothetical protein
MAYESLMTSLLRPYRPACALAFAIGLGCAPALHAESLPFAGRWLLDRPPATPAAYTMLAVDDAGLAWSAPKGGPRGCAQRFVPRREKPGTVYLDGRGKKFVAGAPGSIPTYLLDLAGGNCRGIEDQLRISYPLIYDVGHIEIIEYVKGRPMSSRRFHRAPDPVKPPAPARPDSTGGRRDPRSPGRP